MQGAIGREVASSIPARLKCFFAAIMIFAWTFCMVLFRARVARWVHYGERWVTIFRRLHRRNSFLARWGTFGRDVFFDRQSFFRWRALPRR
jgi:hypothetical protein